MPWADKEKQREYNKRKWSENKELGQSRNRKSYLKQRPKILRDKYGISLDDYEQMFNKQNGVCAICGIKREKLCIDHDHSTGIIRGLLCNKCNFALGLVDDNKETLQKMIEYISKNT